MNELVLSINGQQVETPAGLPSIPPGFSGINKIVSFAVNLLFVVGVILTLAYLIWAAYNYIESGGNKDKKHSAKRQITFCIVGLIIMFLAYFFIRIVSTIFGFQLFY
jgi:cell division protein FtsW (lipid II flippase)